MIIESLLDTDLYKLTMMQAVLHRFPAAEVAYELHCRTPGAMRDVPVERVREEVAHLCSLRFAPHELDYLRCLRYIKPDFVEILRLFHLQAEHVRIDKVDGELVITIHGPWLHTILFEVPILAIVSELYAQQRGDASSQAEGEARLEAKISAVQAFAGADHFRFAEFGTRRRFSRRWQQHVIARLAEALPRQLVGTSNVLFAMQQGLAPVGTMAHEFLQAAQALGPRLVDSQRYALEAWVQEYRGDLGIALSDVIGLEAFLRDFDLYFCKLFDGVRQDSGDPFAWGERMLEHYEAMRVDARAKTFVFSDGLDMAKAFALHRRFAGRVNTSFGIGTHLTNDMGFAAPGLVIKMTRCNGQAVAKISDDAGKTLCADEAYLAYLKKVFAVG
ncbi:MAG TPA: nicotinate phosphoribosyltransferase [Rhodanobacteraceae bacterium]